MFFFVNLCVLCLQIGESIHNYPFRSFSFPVCLRLKYKTCIFVKVKLSGVMKCGFRSYINVISFSIM